MFTSLKHFFVQAMIAVGIMAPATSTPAVLTPIVEPTAIVETVAERPATTTTRALPVQAQDPVPIVKPAEDILIIMDEPAPAKAEPVVYVKSENGACGDDSGKKMAQAPTEYLCTVGDPTSITEKDNAYSWKCIGKGGGRDSSQCQTYKTEDGMCGSLANTIVPPKFGDFTKEKLCIVGFETMVTTSGNQLSWQCGGIFGGKNAMCYAIQATDPNAPTLYQVPAQTPAPTVVTPAPAKVTNTVTKPANPTTYEIPSKCVGLTPIGMAACISTQYPY